MSSPAGAESADVLTPSHSPGWGLPGTPHPHFTGVGSGLESEGVAGVEGLLVEAAALVLIRARAHAEPVSPAQRVGQAPPSPGRGALFPKTTSVFQGKCWRGS